jgi:hypothetical protein
LVDLFEQFLLGSVLRFKRLLSIVYRLTEWPGAVVPKTKWYYLIVAVALAHAHTCTDMVYLGRSAADYAAELCYSGEKLFVGFTHIRPLALIRFCRGQILGIQHQYRQKKPAEIPVLPSSKNR